MSAYNDIRDALTEAFLRMPNERETEVMTPAELAELHADYAIATIMRWTANEPDDSKATNA